MDKKAMDIKFGDKIIHYGDDCRISAHENKGGFEPETRSFLVSKFREHGNSLGFIDVGAYTGIYSIAAELYGAKVLSIEPDLDNYYEMLNNFEMNLTIPFFSKSVAGERFEEIDFYTSDVKFTSGGSIYKNPSMRNRQRVLSIPLDAHDIFLRTLDPIYPLIVKIDVEGAELDVLKGAKITVKEYLPLLIIEVLDKSKFIEIVDMLKTICHSYKIVKKLDKANYVFMAEDA
jgi:FkbM family methyltransferase